jgi:bacterioferritin-associated ferredoxin
MIICSCNVLTDSDVREVVSGANPPRNPCHVHRHLGCQVRCGRCVRSIRKIMDEKKAEPVTCEEHEAKAA